MKKRILIVADYFEPGYKAGGPIASIKNIMAAIGDTATIYLLTGNYDIGETVPYDLPTKTWLDREGYKVMYLSDKEFNRAFIRELVSTLQPDSIYLNSFFSWKASIQFVLNRDWHDRILLAPRGEFHSGSMAIRVLKKKVFLALANATGLYRNVGFHASSELETANIHEYVKVRDVLIAPDLIDVTRLKQKQGYRKREGALRLCFIARMVKNKDPKFCIEALHAIGAKDRDITLDIYGPVQDEQYWDECKALISAYGLEDKITYKGLLQPSQVVDTFSQYDFFFFPTWGENFGHVIYESISVGTPLILSNTTLWSHMSPSEAWSYFFDAGNMSQVCAILEHCVEMNEQQYAELSRAAFQVASSFATSPELTRKTLKLFGLQNSK